MISAWKLLGIQLLKCMCLSSLILSHFFPSLVIVVIHYEKWKLLWSSNLGTKSPPLLFWSEAAKKFSCWTIYIIMFTYSAWYCHYCTVIDGKLKVILYFVYSVVSRWQAFEMTGGLASQPQLLFLVHNYEKCDGGGYDLQGVLCNLMTSFFYITVLHFRCEWLMNIRHTRSRRIDSHSAVSFI